MPRKPKFLHDTRAITPVLSNLLLMVVAVAAMAIATTATYVITTNLKETMSERFIIEDLWVNNSTEEISVFLRNTGKVAFRVSSVYVNQTRRPMIPNDFSLEIGQQGWLNVSCSVDSGKAYHVDIVTSRGTHVADYCKAP